MVLLNLLTPTGANVDTGASTSGSALGRLGAAATSSADSISSGSSSGGSRNLLLVSALALNLFSAICTGDSADFPEPPELDKERVSIHYIPPKN